MWTRSSDLSRVSILVWMVFAVIGFGVVAHEMAATALKSVQTALGSLRSCIAFYGVLSKPVPCPSFLNAILPFRSVWL